MRIPDGHFVRFPNGAATRPTAFKIIDFEIQHFQIFRFAQKCSIFSTKNHEIFERVVQIQDILFLKLMLEES